MTPKELERLKAEIEDGTIQTVTIQQLRWLIREAEQVGQPLEPFVYPITFDRIARDTRSAQLEAEEGL